MYQVAENNDGKGLSELLTEIRSCSICKGHLPLPPNPVLRASETAKILVVGQAPGTRVHHSGIPWNDPSGDRLRKWMDLTREVFYDEAKLAIIPMGFCYPGRGKSGDLPPRKECAPTWHHKLLNYLPNIQLTLLIGQYAQQYYLGKNKKKTLSETVRGYSEYLPNFFPLVHPSPRNTLWLKRNPWFEEDVVPFLKHKVHLILGGDRLGPL